MENILILMWLADMSNSIKLAGGLSFFAFIMISIFVIAFVGAGDIKGADAETWAEVKKYYKRLSSYIFIPLILIAFALPSKNTLYAAAAFKAGEVVVKSDALNKYIKIIDTYLENINNVDKR